MIRSDATRVKIANLRFDKFVNYDRIVSFIAHKHAQITKLRAKYVDTLDLMCNQARVM